MLPRRRSKAARLDSRAAGAVAAVTAAATMTLALAGCGGSASQPPAALPGVNVAQDSANASASATSSVAGQIPADYKVDIEINPTGDPTQDALMGQTRAMLMAYEQAVSRNNPSDSLYQSLTTSFARGNLYSMINSFAKSGVRPTGSVRFYRFTVKFTGKVADVFFCQDTSKAIPVSFKTGQKAGAAATGAAAFSWWDTAFEKSSGEAWAIVYASAQVGRQSCMR